MLHETRPQRGIRRSACLFLRGLCSRLNSRGSQQNKELPPATSHEITILEELLPNHLFHIQTQQIDKMKERDGMPPPSELSNIRILKLKL